MEKIRLVCISVVFLMVLTTDRLSAQSMDAVISSSSCEPGGAIWVCGTSQVAQTHSNFNSNCSDVSYKCGKTLKTIVDVCSPIITESEITSEGCSDDD